MSYTLFNFGMVVFSTHVEVILFCSVRVQFFSSILHTCGGDPKKTLFYKRWLKVFSTHVEVIPMPRKKDPEIYGILHTCGGDP